MREIEGNLWDFHNQGYWVVVTTNGCVKNNGACVMGRGTALVAARRYPLLPFELGEAIRWRGNKFYKWVAYRIFTFPVKNDWRDKADFALIEKSCQELGRIGSSPELKVYLTRPGCGNGRLDWINVKPILEEYLDDRFIVVEQGGS